MNVSVTRQMYRRKNRRYARYRVELARGDGAAALAVAEYDDSRDARALADWLSQHGVGRCEAGRREASP
ncbi:MAG TPA: hypothetical protein VGY66_15255 [Gemmataceae bacterium]|nr:hypothetical protein [Gemmataceae bacterium]